MDLKVNIPKGAVKYTDSHVLNLRLRTLPLSCTSGNFSKRPLALQPHDHGLRLADDSRYGTPVS